MKKNLIMASDDNIFVDLLQLISVTSKTGVLTAIRGQDTIKLYFHKGKLISVFCEDPLRFFGQYLIKEGIISEETLKKALQMQEKKGGKNKLGEIISEIEGIPLEKILPLLESMYKELLFDMFLWSDMRCYFSEVKYENFKGFKLDIDINDLIVEGIKRLNLWKEIKEYIKNENLVFARNEDKKGSLIKLSKLEKKIYDLLKIPSTVNELMRATRSSEFEVSLALYNLLKKELVFVFSERKVKENFYDKKRNEMKTKIRECLENLDFEGARRNLFEFMHFIINGDEFEEAKDSIDSYELKYLRSKFDYNSKLKVKVDMSELKSGKLSQMEAFLLSRINGGIDINSLLKLVPLKEVEVLKLLNSLKERGFIE